MFNSRKEALENFLDSALFFKDLLNYKKEKTKIKNYYVNPGMINGFKQDLKKPLIKIRFTNFTYTLSLIKGDENNV